MYDLSECVCVLWGWGWEDEAAILRLTDPTECFHDKRPPYPLAWDFLLQVAVPPTPCGAPLPHSCPTTLTITHTNSSCLFVRIVSRSAFWQLRKFKGNPTPTGLRRCVHAQHNDT